MDIQFHGANCVSIATKQIRLVFDDNLEAIGSKSVTRPDDISLYTGPANEETAPKGRMLIDIPGEYEVSGVSIRGMQNRSHMDTESERNATIYKVTVGDIKVLIVGHIFPKLSEAKLEDINQVDIMIVPVGGNGYTLDPEGASQVIKQIEPKLVIPTHFDDKSLKFEVPQHTLEDAIKTIGLEPKETLKKFSPKTADLTETTQLIILEKS